MPVLSQSHKGRAQRLEAHGALGILARHLAPQTHHLFNLIGLKQAANFITLLYGRHATLGWPGAASTADGGIRQPLNQFACGIARKPTTAGIFQNVLSQGVLTSLHKGIHQTDPVLAIFWVGLQCSLEKRHCSQKLAAIYRNCPEVMVSVCVAWREAQHCTVQLFGLRQIL
ncbi:MAG: hypothetical protein O9331_21000 [Acidovorax sp.]|nr:hypothetical protein [Acidovorax sp.]